MIKNECLGPPDPPDFGGKYLSKLERPEKNIYNCPAATEISQAISTELQENYNFNYV